MYLWQRYLCPVGESYARTDAGYLIAPTQDHFFVPNEHLVSLAELRDVNCVTVLGEPGIGKSSVLAQEAEALRAEEASVIEEEFAMFLSASDLDRELLNRDEYIEWRNGESNLYIFLDGLDEAPLRPDLLISALSRKLKGHPLNRLFLRIASRAEVWTKGIEMSLASLWERQSISTYTVTVLSKQDIASAAIAEGLDPSAFMQSISEREVEALASVPLTLNLILSSSLQNGVLPSSRNEIYEQGCLSLCQHDYDGGASMTPPAERIIIAEYLAATTLFAQRSVIDGRFARSPSLSRHAIHIDELINSPEHWNGRDIVLNERTLNETLRTGLFASNPGGTYSWVHRSYQEYLTARYLRRHNLPIPQLNALLNAPLNPTGKYPPQLENLVGWLVDLIPEIRSTIITRDLVAALGSDKVNLDRHERYQLVETLIAATEERRHFPSPREQHRYHKLYHPGLAQQLLQHLTEQEHGLDAQRVITDIAEQCKLKQLQDFYARRALDVSVDERLRLDAIAFVSRFGDEPTKVRLKPLLQRNDHDSYNEIKAYTIRALWPSLLSTSELFAVIEPTWEQSALTLYEQTISHFIHPHLEVGDLPVALAWVERSVQCAQLADSAEDLIDEILALALKHCEDPQLCETIAQTLLTKSEADRNIFGRRQGRPQYHHEIALTEAQRRSLFRTLLVKSIEQKRPVRNLIHIRPRLVSSKDFMWLARDLFLTLSSRQCRALAQILPDLWDPQRREQVELAYELARTHKSVRWAFHCLFGPINIRSSVAAQMKKVHQSQQDTRILTIESVRLVREPQIEGFLDKIEAGDIQLYWQLDQELTYDAERDWYEYALNVDPAQLPGWTESSVTTRGRIVKAAKEFIVNGSPHNETWFNVDYTGQEIDLRALAGYRALRLLYQEDTQFLEQLPQEIWAKWLPAILTAPNVSVSDSAHYRLIDTARCAAHKQYVASVITILTNANSSTKLQKLAQYIRDFWEPEFSSLVWAKLNDHPDESQKYEYFLPHVFGHDREVATDLAARLLGNSNASLPPTTRTRIAGALLYKLPNVGWDAVWQLVQSDEELGQAILMSLAFQIRWDESQWLQTVELSRLKALLCWLLAWAEKHPRPSFSGGFRQLQDEDYLYRLLSSLKSLLIQHGSTEAVEILEHVQEEFPMHEDLAKSVYLAQENLRKSTWQPTPPKELSALVRNTSLRLIRNADDLLTVVLESLDRLNNKLQGETPSAIDLWNEVINIGGPKKGKRERVCTPKEEERLSDYVKRHLESDLSRRLITVSREVELRYGHGVQKGQRSDIYITAPAHSQGDSKSDVVRVVIEVKANWHRELLTALETQLFEQYMKMNSISHGLYLVGWYNCESWDLSDGGRSNNGRRQQAYRYSREAVESKLDQQAQQLSSSTNKIAYFILDTALT